MKLIFHSIVGGVFVMTAAALFWLFTAERFFIWVMAWPALLLRPFFPEPSPDQIFPALGGYAGILTTFAVSALAYSILLYLVLRLCKWSRRPS